MTFTFYVAGLTLLDALLPNYKVQLVLRITTALLCFKCII